MLINPCQSERQISFLSASFKLISKLQSLVSALFCREPKRNGFRSLSLQIPPVSPLHTHHANPSVGSPGEDYRSRVERYAHAERELLFLSAGAAACVLIRRARRTLCLQRPNKAVCVWAEHSEANTALVDQTNTVSGWVESLMEVRGGGKELIKSL